MFSLALLLTRPDVEILSGSMKSSQSWTIEKGTSELHWPNDALLAGMFPL